MGKRRAFSIKREEGTKRIVTIGTSTRKYLSLGCKKRGSKKTLGT